MSGGKINDEFVRLKLKMYSLKNIDGKETNMEKGVSVATEFNEFKDVLFNKKLMHKMRRIQSKKHKIGTYEIKKSLYYVLMIKHLFQKIHTRASHKKEEILTDKKDSKRVIMKKRDSKDSHGQKEYKRILEKEEIFTDKKNLKRILIKRNGYG